MFKNFSVKQLTALTWWCKESKLSNCDGIICDGAVRSGKTTVMALSFVLWSFAKFNGNNFALCGKTISSLKRNVIVSLVAQLHLMGFTVKEKISSNYIDITYEKSCNRFYLFGGKDESSASLIQGITLSGVLFDEVALMPRSFVEQALARCSVCGSTFWFNCNPEGPFHWFYLEWIKKCKEKNMAYLHFTMEDNPSLTTKIKNRYRSLYSGTFYQRFIEGKWVATEGLIYPDYTSYLCKPFKYNFKRYIVSCDYGTVNPSSFGLWGEKDSVWYRIDEYYFDSRKEKYSRTDEEHLQGLMDLIGDKKEKIQTIIIDPSAASFITLVRGKSNINVIPAENAVVDGIRKVASALKCGEIRIFDTCVSTVKEFGLYKWQNNLSRDLPVKEHDHAMDDIRYFISFLHHSSEDELFIITPKRY